MKILHWAGPRIFISYILSVIIGCNSSKWMEIQVNNSNLRNENDLLISKEFVSDLPFTYVCFLESDMETNVEKFKKATKVFFIKNQNNERVYLDKWLDLKKNDSNYICAIYSQDYGVKTEFHSLEVVSEYLFKINKIFWTTSSQ